MTDTDRELLEWAAIAIGQRVSFYRADAAYIDENEAPGFYWNPLEDDGDALRLAAQLGFMVVIWRESGKTYAGNEDWDGAMESHNGDPLAATRRAIVKAAAEIGRRMA